jgi:hypothetical protein
MCRQIHPFCRDETLNKQHSELFEFGEIQTMSSPNQNPPAQLFKRWHHSHEEDHDDIQVFRPADYALPRARGRMGIEFRPDGTSTRYGIGRGDAPTIEPGRWQMIGSNRIQVQSQAAAGARVSNLEIVRLDDNVLEVRQQ